MAFWDNMKNTLSNLVKQKQTKIKQGISHKGMLVFAHTGEVITAERILRKAGYEVEVKGPPPELHTGCDMIIIFDMFIQIEVMRTLQENQLPPLKIVPVEDTLLEPVDFYNITDFGQWYMVRAANMKITIDKKTERVVNVSGGGCPDVPYLAQGLIGVTLAKCTEPIQMGKTLCCYSLQRAFEEARRYKCG